MKTGHWYLQKKCFSIDNQNYHLFYSGALDKLGNCPFASLIATIIVFVGVGVFCGTLYRALQIIIINVMDRLFQFSVSWSVTQFQIVTFEIFRSLIIISYVCYRHNLFLQY